MQIFFQNTIFTFLVLAYMSFLLSFMIAGKDGGKGICNFFSCNPVTVSKMIFCKHFDVISCLVSYFVSSHLKIAFRRFFDIWIKAFALYESCNSAKFKAFWSTNYSPLALISPRKWRISSPKQQKLSDLFPIDNIDFKTMGQLHILQPVHWAPNSTSPKSWWVNVT